VTLPEGSYILLPRTTGCTLRRPDNIKFQNLKLLSPNDELTPLTRMCILDIFRKFDMLLNRELSFIEFKGFYECINLEITEEEFNSQILSKYASSSKGLSSKGFLDFIRDTIV